MAAGFDALANRVGIAEEPGNEIVGDALRTVQSSSLVQSRMDLIEALAHDSDISVDDLDEGESEIWHVVLREGD